MTYKTHIAFASAISIPIALELYSMRTMNFSMFMSSMVIGSLTPDLDEKGSYLSRKIPIVSMVLELFGVKHREVTHRLISVIFLIALFSTLLYFKQVSESYSPLFYGFTLGYFLHLCGDMLTKGGINKFFYPVSNIKGVLLPRKLRFYTGSNTESVLFGLILIIVSIETLSGVGII